MLLSGANVTLTYSIRNTANVRAHNVSLSLPGVDQISCGNGLGSRIPSIDVDATAICRCATADALEMHASFVWRFYMHAPSLFVCLPSVFLRVFSVSACGCATVCTRSRTKPNTVYCLSLQRLLHLPA